MLLFPTLCVDNFFNTPDQVLAIAKECPMEKTQTRPGTRSPCLSQINFDFYNYVNTKLIRVFYPSKDFSYSATTHFQSTFPDDNILDGWVHLDNDYMFTAIVYLNHCNVGTSIFTKRNEFTVPDNRGDVKHNYFKKHESMDNPERLEVKEVRDKVNSQFDESIIVKGRYNRMMCFDGNSYHSIQDGICDEERLILISFIKDVRLHGEKTVFPIPQMNLL